MCCSPHRCNTLSHSGLTNVKTWKKCYILSLLQMSHLISECAPWEDSDQLGHPPSLKSESSLCTPWVAKDPSFLHTDSEDSDQTGRMPRSESLLGAHAILLVLSWGGSNEIVLFQIQTHLLCNVLMITLIWIYVGCIVNCHLRFIISLAVRGPTGLKLHDPKKVNWKLNF